MHALCVRACVCHGELVSMCATVTAPNRTAPLRPGGGAAAVPDADVDISHVLVGSGVVACVCVLA